MKKNIQLFITIFLLSFSYNSYGQIESMNPVSVVSENKDTLFLADNKVGKMILEVWEDDYQLESPVIIIKSEDWILTEKIKRKSTLVATKPKQRR